MMPKTIRRSLFVLVCVVLMFAGQAVCLRAQGGTASTVPVLRGYSSTESQTERDWEQKFRAIPDVKNLRENMYILSSEPHHVGSPKDKSNAEFILKKFHEFGLKAEIEEFEVLFPTPKERLVELLEPEKYTAQLKEPAVPQDPDSTDAGQLPTYNAYSADGDVTAQVVYVNYGTPKDYEELDKLDISVKGKIVLARYGASWRGIKPKVAYEHGAIGCLIYSDPRDDGYTRGDIYPEGPMRPWQGVQRGSVADMPIYPGDPETPGWASVKGAKRLSLSEAKTLMKIPVLPISYGDAQPILRNLRGPVAPEAWRGALPITYHIGPGPAVVHLKASFNWNVEPIYDVVARIDGSTAPDEWIVRGNHHDAWVNGASDPISGQVALIEEARAYGQLLKQGWQPHRTIIYAAWDGEEPGLLGSTEWAEKHADELKKHAVAYINSDSNGKGWLGASGSHTLEDFVNEVAKDIRDPESGKSVWEAWKQRQIDQAKTDQDKKEIRERADLRIGALGSGSDYTVYIDHLGIASLNLGFGGGGGDGGVYHSIYDDFAWYTRFGDTTFEYGRALSQTVGTMVMRLADAPVLPFQFQDFSDTVAKYITELDKLEKDVKPPQSFDLTPLHEAAGTLKQSADRYHAAFEKRAAGNWGLAPAQMKSLNTMLFMTERKLTNAQGLPSRSWFEHEIYAPGLYTGYGVKTIPGVREALEQKNWGDVVPQMNNVVKALRDMSAEIDDATKVLEGQ
ncbi:MAG: transferrin receptor-like dimerization domain-containing protein [Acidobacteriia bacterium]|nr:transferrin receptor-like dimerization domain-containing protein [Terriglobia bacterium]